MKIATPSQMSLRVTSTRTMRSEENFSTLPIGHKVAESPSSSWEPAKRFFGRLLVPTPKAALIGSLAGTLAYRIASYHGRSLASAQTAYYASSALTPLLGQTAGHYLGWGAGYIGLALINPETIEEGAKPIGYIVGVLTTLALNLLLKSPEEPSPLNQARPPLNVKHASSEETSDYGKERLIKVVRTTRRYPVKKGVKGWNFSKASAKN